MVISGSTDYQRIKICPFEVVCWFSQDASAILNLLVRKTLKMGQAEKTKGGKGVNIFT